MIQYLILELVGISENGMTASCILLLLESNNTKGKSHCMLWLATLTIDALIRTRSRITISSQDIMSIFSSNTPQWIEHSQQCAKFEISFTVRFQCSPLARQSQV